MRTRENIEALADEYFAEGRQAFFDNKQNNAGLLVQNALHLYKKAENYEKYAVTLNLMGVIYAATGNETMAIDYYLEGLEYAIDNHYNNIITLFYNNIGSRYQELKEHEKAIRYFKKAAEALEYPTCKAEPRHDSWCLVTYMNLASSCCELKAYGQSWRYLHMAEPYMEKDADSMYKYTFLIFKCRLYWCCGKKEYVYKHLGELLESGTKDSNASDYVQDMKNLCRLLSDMGEYDCWREIILAFEHYVREQNTVYIKLIQTEMWMDYYQAMDDMDEYIGLCVEHAKLYRRQKEINDRERASAIDIKIALREKEVQRKKAEAKSSTDALTGLGNRYLLEEKAKIFAKEAADGQKRIAVGVLDIDCFKQHNDTYGHIKGDTCLREIANALRKAVSELGHVYRYGGDEFVILMPGDDIAAVEQVAKNVQEFVRLAEIDNVNSAVIPKVTISQGYSCFVPTGDEEGVNLIEHADKALYQVKEAGRNGYRILIE